MVFPVVMDGCERWTVKKAERGRIDAFELYGMTVWALATRAGGRPREGVWGGRVCRGCRLRKRE